MKNPLISVIVTTKNNQHTIRDCLNSVVNQNYSGIELIVVDNFSTDKTLFIARNYTDLVFQIGPERSVQRNFGVSQAGGDYVLIVDSDMVLSLNVISQCVNHINKGNIKGLVIPEESYGVGFWASAKKLERTFYVGVPWMEAARFIEKKSYSKLGGYDPELISGEDWDLSQKLQELGQIGRIDAHIYHNEGQLKLIKTLRKKYYYAKHFAKYKRRTNSINIHNQTSLYSRYKLFLSKPRKLIANPLVSSGMLFMKTSEFVCGATGYLVSKLSEPIKGG